LSFSQRVGALLERTEYRRAESEADVDAILRLRYDAFFRERAIPFHASGRLEDNFDQSENVYNLAVFIDGELAGALRVHALLRVGQRSPALEAFGQYLLPELKAGKVIVDPNRFVASYELARRYPELPYLTLRAGFLAGIYFGADIVTITVRAEHQAFYRKNLFARVVCPPRAYPILSKPISLMFMDFVSVMPRTLHRHPYWASSELERQAMFGKGPTLMRATNPAIAAA
jgi:N-acyl-L-homoserine lactone synthetase